MDNEIRATNHDSKDAFIRHRTNFRSAKKFDRPLCSHGTVQYFRSFRTELYNRTVKVLRVDGTPKRTNPVPRTFFLRKWVAKRTNFQPVESSFSAVLTKHKRSLKHALLPQPFITGHHAESLF